MSRETVGGGGGGGPSTRFPSPLSGLGFPHSLGGIRSKRDREMPHLLSEPDRGLLNSATVGRKHRVWGAGGGEEEAPLASD